MSHNTALGSPPHVTAVTPGNIVAAGATTITITGGNLSPSCQLDIGALGTVTGPGVYTAVSVTTGTLAFPVTALAPPATPATITCTLSNGGMVSTGAAISIVHTPTWDPSLLMTDPADTWLRAVEAAGFGSGGRVSSLAPAYGNRGTLTSSSSTSDRPVYITAAAELNGEPGISSTGSGARQWLIPTANYLFQPSSLEFTIAACWAPRSGASNMSRFSLAPSWYPSVVEISFWDGVPTEDLYYAYFGGTQVVTSLAYPNTGTANPRRLIMSGGGGSTASISEPVTGINLTGLSVGTDGLNSAFRMFDLIDSVFAEMIYITGRTITPTEQTLLNTYWLNKYG